MLNVHACQRGAQSFTRMNQETFELAFLRERLMARGSETIPQNRMRDPHYLSTGPARCEAVEVLPVGASGDM